MTLLIISCCQSISFTILYHPFMGLHNNAHDSNGTSGLNWPNCPSLLNLTSFSFEMYQCGYAFANCGLADVWIGLILLAISLMMLTGCLVILVRCYYIFSAKYISKPNLIILLYPMSFNVSNNSFLSFETGIPT